MEEFIFRIKLLFEIFKLEQFIYGENRIIDRSKLTKENSLITLINIHQNLNEKLTLKLKKE
jgi:hypothetical protein